MLHFKVLSKSTFTPEGKGKLVYKDLLKGTIKEEDLVEVSKTDLKLEFKTLNPIQSLFYKTYQKGNAVVAAPTSAGKSGIAYIFLHNRKGRVVYAAPTKALVSEKAKELKKLFGKVDIRTGEVIEEFKPVRSQIVVSTYENLALAIRNQSPWFEDVEAVVIDEIHALLGNRGQILEEVIAELLSQQIDILGLSATLPGADKLAGWLKASLFIESDWRPVPLERRIIPLKDFKYWIKPQELDDIGSDERFALRMLTAIFELAERDEKVIAFVPKKSIGWKMLEFANHEHLEIANKTTPFEVKKEGFEIAFHNADVPKEEREEIEKSFREGNLNILIATQTLAYGVNLPADKVLIGVKAFWDQNERKYRIFPDTLDILQEEGRAGRFGIKEKGFSYILPYGSRVEVVKKSLNQALEREFETFLSRNLKENASFKGELLKQLTLFVLVAILHRKGDFKKFLQESFSFRLLYNHPVIDEAVEWLKLHGFIDKKYQLTEKGKFCLKSGVPPVNFEEFVRRKSLPLPVEAILRPLLYTKKFDSIYQFLKNFPHFEELNERIISELAVCGAECIKDNTHQFLFFTRGFTVKFVNISNPPGEFSYLGTDVLHLMRLLLELRNIGEIELTNEEILRIAHTIKYGLPLSYAPLGGIKGIGHIRANLLRETLQMEGIKNLDHFQFLKETLEPFEENLKENLLTAAIEYRGLPEDRAKREVKTILSLLRRNKETLLVDDKILTTFGLFLLGRTSLGLKKQELLKKVLEKE